MGSFANFYFWWWVVGVVGVELWGGVGCCACMSSLFGMRSLFGALLAVCVLGGVVFGVSAFGAGTGWTGCLDWTGRTGRSDWMGACVGAGSDLPCVFAGTALPYGAAGDSVGGPDWGAVPDSLAVVFVNHVGRHGARFLSSDRTVASLSDFLRGRGELSLVGRRLSVLCGAVDSVTGERWGALDALGRVEQSGIGDRFAVRYAGLLGVNDGVWGFSSYVPRCVMSMDEMTHGVVWRARGVELCTGSGRRFDALLRPFDVDSAYLAYRRAGEWRCVLEGFCDSVCPAAVALRLDMRGVRFVERLCGELARRGVPESGCVMEAALADTLAGEWPAEWVSECGLTKGEALGVARSLYKLVSGVVAMNYEADSLPVGVCADWRWYFTEGEYERLWECGNLEHYLTYSANGLSEAPALMARGLLGELVSTLEAASERGYAGPGAIVRFGHAETMMPLEALMDLPGCRYVTDDWGSVAEHWQDWNVAPMAVNVQLVLCRGRESGELYLLTFRNERLVRGVEPWAAALSWLRESLCGGCGVSGR